MLLNVVLSKNELLTPDIDKVMGGGIFRRRAQNTKLAKIGRLNSVFFSQPQERGKLFQKILLRSSQADAHLKIILVRNGSVEFGE